MKTELLELETRIAKLLRRGVLLAGLFIFAGWMSQISFTKNVFINYQSYSENPLFNTLKNLLDQNAYGTLLAYLGLTILISLPILRVIMTGLIFIKQKDFRMVGLVAIVILGLAISIALGFKI